MFTEQSDYLAFAAIIVAVFAAVAYWLKRFRGLTLPGGLVGAAVMILGARWGWTTMPRAFCTRCRPRAPW